MLGATTTPPAQALDLAQRLLAFDPRDDEAMTGLLATLLALGRARVTGSRAAPAPVTRALRTPC